MNADELRKFAGQLAGLQTPDDMSTLRAMQEYLSLHMACIQFVEMFAWIGAGWQPNAPGLCCQRCGGMTWGRQIGHREQIRCINTSCGVTREVWV